MILSQSFFVSKDLFTILLNTKKNTVDLCVSEKIIVKHRRKLIKYVSVFKWRYLLLSFTINKFLAVHLHVSQNILALEKH